jgi:hypothetical protein
LPSGASLIQRYWLGLSGGRTRETAPAERHAWVEQVGLVQYRGYFAKLPPCWPSHAEAVIEFHPYSGVAPDLRRPGQQALQDALVWNDKWLHGVLGRLGAAIKCDVSGCRLAKPSPWERSLPRYS